MKETSAKIKYRTQHLFENCQLKNLFYRNCVESMNGNAKKNAYGKYKKAHKFPALIMNISA